MQYKMREHSLQVITISTTLPRRCGIATFNEDVARELRAAGLAVRNIALERGHQHHAYPASTITVIRQDDRRDYLRAAELINTLQPDVVLLQHEFGIFGGDSGEYVVDLLARLTVPTVTVIHTYPFTQHTAQQQRQAALLRQIGAFSTTLITISETARQALVMDFARLRLVTPVMHIPHGTPNVHEYHRLARRSSRAGHRLVLATFGLISERKGLDQVIAALPPVTGRYPQVRYRIIGAPHPADRDARRYLQRVHQQAVDLNLARHVHFTTRFLSVQEIMESLRATDIYVTFYSDPNQASSGTLAYALAAGCCVVSTPYVHARELLSEGRGVLVPFGSRTALTRALLSLLDHPANLLACQQRALAYGSTTAWSRVGRQYVDVIRRARHRQPSPARSLIATSQLALSSRQTRASEQTKTGLSSPKLSQTATPAHSKA